ncbi:hypothetical protein N9L59_06035, partial [Luminiphilus sp.]|nr:hypothetical protein [Luminiphilus sp.]
AFVKVKFSDFSSTTVERVGTTAVQSDYKQLLKQGWDRREMTDWYWGPTSRRLGARVRTATL